MPAAKRSNVVHPNVSRVDYGSNHGYSVRLCRNGSETNKLFSDGVYGGKDKAKAAAIAWREAQARKLGPAMPLGHRGGDIKPPGYSYIKRKTAYVYKDDGTKVPFDAWVGFLRIENRKHLITKWSIDKWGPIKAKRKCKAWLAQRTAELQERLRRKSRKSRKSRKAKRSASAKSASPVAVSKQLSVGVCGSCGGVVRMMKGPGRSYEFRGSKVMIPQDFATETCVGCGEVYVTDREAEALEQRLESSLKRRGRGSWRPKELCA